MSYRLTDWLARKGVVSLFRRIELGKYFSHWQSNGYHVLPVHYYSPIPNTNDLPEDLWDKMTPLRGVDMCDKEQLEFMQTSVLVFQSEFDVFPDKPGENPSVYYHNNAFFVGADALVLYSLVRSLKPRRIIEVGSGFSTRIILHALDHNEGGELTCIEPYPDAILDNHPGITHLIRKRVQDVDIVLFDDLGMNDILFIDSTHTVKTGSDVVFLFLEVLPRLKPGVVIHVHDIFIPRDYPKDWIMKAHMFSNEQYLLQAFMQYNDTFQVMFCSAYMTIRYQQEVQNLFGKYPRWNEGCSWWMRKVNN